MINDAHQSLMTFSRLENAVAMEVSQDTINRYPSTTQVRRNL